MTRRLLPLLALVTTFALGATVGMIARDTAMVAYAAGAFIALFGVAMLVMVPMLAGSWLLLAVSRRLRAEWRRRRAEDSASHRR